MYVQTVGENVMAANEIKINPVSHTHTEIFDVQQFENTIFVTIDIIFGEFQAALILYGSTHIPLVNKQ